MTSEERTIRLHNVDPGRSQLSINLAIYHQKTASKLRRGSHMHPIVIPAGRYFDMVKELGYLGIDYAAACEVVEHSAELRAHEQAKRLLIRHFPPTAEQLIEEARVEARAKDAEEKTLALNPPDPPHAIPAGVARTVESLTELGLDADTPVQTRWPGPTLPEMYDDKPEDEFGQTFDDSTLEPAEPVEAPKSIEPSMDWEEKDLRAFAAERGIDLGKAKTKTLVLKKIRDALSET